MAGLLLGVKSTLTSTLSSGGTRTIAQIAPAQSGAGARRLVHSHFECGFIGAAATDHQIKVEMYTSTTAGTMTNITSSIKPVQNIDAAVAFGMTAAEYATVEPGGTTVFPGLGGLFTPSSSRPILIASGEYVQIDANAYLNVRIVAGTLAAPIQYWWGWRVWE